MTAAADLGEILRMFSSSRAGRAARPWQSAYVNAFLRWGVERP